MRNVRLYRTDAIVVRRADFGEADRLLTVYTPHLGKLRLLAKGIRRPVSKMGGHLELFTHSRVLIAKGRNLDLVTQSETIDAFLPLRDDLLRMTYAHYVAELLDRLTPEHLEDYPLFSGLLTVLRRLAESRQPDIAVRFYEMELLGQLGYQPQLDQCAQCRRELEPVLNRYSPRLGGALCPSCFSADGAASPLSVNALKVLRLLQSGNYEVGQQLRLDEELSRDVEGLLRTTLHQVLERDINSSAFLQRLRAEDRVRNGP
ncbi:MAG: DNA repair protein RecO [Chloroflexota bacterium]